MDEQTALRCGNVPPDVAQHLLDELSGLVESGYGHMNVVVDGGVIYVEQMFSHKYKIPADILARIRSQKSAAACPQP
jgi:hypothetical protein